LYRRRDDPVLNVKTPEEVFGIIRDNFHAVGGTELLPLEKVNGRILAEDVRGTEYVPGFDRSSVDGYALRARDSFGCSESIPAILRLESSIEMGLSAAPLAEGCCAYVPTGGMIPEGSDCVAMVEHTERFSEGEVAVLKPVSPGENLVYKGDDCRPGQIIAACGTSLKPQHIGSFASLGIARVPVRSKPVVGVISTGDELIAISETPSEGQVRDVNSYLLSSFCEANGCSVISYGIVRDEEAAIGGILGRAVSECDMVLVSGGSSVGQKDATARLIESYGPLLFHGIAMKPGKPTILGRAGEKPLVGLPGHPGASFFVATLFIKPLIDILLGAVPKEYVLTAVLDEAVPANQGRAAYEGVRLRESGGKLHAMPVRAKSGLVTSLTRSDGYICVPRDTEGFARGSEIPVYIF